MLKAIQVKIASPAFGNYQGCTLSMQPSDGRTVGKCGPLRMNIWGRREERIYFTLPTLRRANLQTALPRLGTVGGYFV